MRIDCWNNPWCDSFCPSTSFHRIHCLSIWKIFVHGFNCFFWYWKTHRQRPSINVCHWPKKYLIYPIYRKFCALIHPQRLSRNGLVYMRLMLELRTRVRAIGSIVDRFFCLRLAWYTWIHLWKVTQRET